MVRFFVSATVLCAVFATLFVFNSGHAETRRTERDLFASLISGLGIKDQDDFYTRVDKAREFVHRNSIHKADAEFYSYWGNNEKITQLFHDRMTGKSATGPHLECSSRSYIMAGILKELGFAVRTVTVYRAADKFPAHVFLEVQNPEDGAWHAQDPDYDIYWRLKKTKKRAGISDLVSLPYETFEPCMGGTECGWELVNGEGRKPGRVRDFLGLASITGGPGGKRPLLVNTGRFGQLQDFCAFVPKNCRGQITKY